MGVVVVVVVGVVVVVVVGVVVVVVVVVLNYIIKFIFPDISDMKNFAKLPFQICRICSQIFLFIFY